MAIIIFWSDEAKLTFENNVKYLKEFWTEKEIANFVQQTNYIITRVSEHPESYHPSFKNKKVRRARLNKHITLYYRYYSSKKEIVLLTFWNTKKDPMKSAY